MSSSKYVIDYTFLFLSFFCFVCLFVLFLFCFFPFFLFPQSNLEEGSGGGGWEGGGDALR